MPRALRLALFCACAAGAAGAGAQAAVAAIDTTLRVEGLTTTLIPERVVSLNDSGGEGSITDSFDSDFFIVPLASASAQLTLGAAAVGVPVGYDVLPAGSVVKQIGPNAAGAPLGSSWRMKVNDQLPATGPDDVILMPGDRVTWAFVTNTAAPELDVQVPATPVETGATFPVTVVGYNNAGTPAPVQGVTVAYRDAVALTGPDGTATLLANGAGPAPVTASKLGTVRAKDEAVCAYPAADPSVCGIGPPPPPPPPPPPGTTSTTPTTTSPRPKPPEIKPMCAAVPKRPPPGTENPKAVQLSVGQLITNQRISQAAVRRANGILLWLEAGLIERDLCGASIGPNEVAPGFAVDLDGSRDAGTRAKPRPVEIQPPVRVDASTVQFTPEQLLINQRISQAAVRRANALQERIDSGLTGGDIRDGAITVRKTVPGMRIASTPQAGGKPPERSPTRDAEPEGRGRAVQATRLQLLINQRIAQTAVRRVNALLDKLATGFTGEDIHNGSLTIDDFAPGVRRPATGG